MDKEYRVNEYITLKLEGIDTNIYINEIKFMQCKRLVLNIPVKDVRLFTQVDSIDEASEYYDHYWYEHEIYKEDQRGLNHTYYSDKISPEAEFWGHCSNLQVWVEMNYDTRILHSNLAFPLLKKLVEAGDVNAKRVLKEEIVIRYVNGNETVQTYLMEQKYLTILGDEEFKQLVMELIERENFYGLDLLGLNMLNRIKFNHDEVIDLIFDSNYEFNNWVNNFLKEKPNAGLIIHRILYSLFTTNLSQADEFTKNLYKMGFKKCFFCADNKRRLDLMRKTFLPFFDTEERENFFNFIDFEVINDYPPEEALQKLSHFVFYGSDDARQLLHDKIKKFFNENNEDMIRHIVDCKYIQYLEPNELEFLLENFDYTIITEQEVKDPFSDKFYRQLETLAKFGYSKANQILKEEFFKRFKEDQLEGVDFLEMFLSHLTKAELEHFLEGLNYNTIINQHYSHTFNTLSRLEELGISKAKKVFKQLYGPRSLVTLFSDMASNKQEIPYEKKLNLLRCILVPTEFTFLQELQSLIDEDIKIYIDPRITSFPSIVIEQRRISQIRMVGINIEELPKSIGNLDSLKILNLNYNQLPNLPKEIGRITTLEELLLRKNTITELPKTIGKLMRLQKLDLTRNKLKTLPRSITKLKRLEYLNLNFNNFQNLSKKIGNLKSLEYLFCDYNQLTNLPSIFHKLRSLRRIDLHGNKLKTIPRALLSLNSIKQISLSRDYLDEETINLLKSIKIEHSLFVKNADINHPRWRFNNSDVEPLNILFGKFTLRFFYEWGGPNTIFWTVNDEARAKYGYPVRLDDLPLSSDIIEESSSLYKRFAQRNPRATQVNENELKEFKKETVDIYLKAIKQLGSNFQVKFQMEGYGLPYER